MPSENSFPRVLATSVSSWSSKTGSDTLSSLFQTYDSEKVAALYIRADKSDSTRASRYFHIFEGQVVNSIFKRNVITGEEFRPEQVDVYDTNFTEKAETKRYNLFRRYRWGVFILLREVLWKIGKWNSKELNIFLEEVNPEVLVCPIESYIHFNTINEYIIKKYEPRVIGFLWDDNFTYKQNHNFWHLIHRYFVRRSVRRMVKQCDVIFALSPKMKEEADAEFGINCILLTKPIFNTMEYKSYIPCNPIRILYTGKLIIGRDETIAKVVEAIKTINATGQKVLLDIYTNTELSPSMEKRINVQGCCNLHPPVPQSKVIELQREADVLLFAESLSDKNLTARLSFSTKLTDYFAAGKCIWGVGHRDLGPISYLQSEDAGLVSNNGEEILKVLEDMVFDDNLITTYAKKSHDCGIKNHDGEIILNKFNNALLGK